MQFLGSGEPRPLPYGVPHEPFAISRMLAWDASAASALVVGREAFRRGFYLLDTAPGDGVTAPRYIGPVSGTPYGTFSLDDTVFVETADGLFATIDGHLVRLQPPADAPRPRDRSSGSADRRIGPTWHTRCDERLGRRRGTRGDRDGGPPRPRRPSDRRGRGPRSHPRPRVAVPLRRAVPRARRRGARRRARPHRRPRRRHPCDRRTDRRVGRVPFRAVGGPPVGGVGARRPLARASGRCPAARAPSAADVPRRRRRARTHPRMRYGRHRRGR